jgi:hypothetical protein
LNDQTAYESEGYSHFLEENLSTKLVGEYFTEKHWISQENSHFQYQSRIHLLFLGLRQLLPLAINLLEQ